MARQNLRIPSVNAAMASMAKEPAAKVFSGKTIPEAPTTRLPPPAPALPPPPQTRQSPAESTPEELPGPVPVAPPTFLPSSHVPTQEPVRVEVDQRSRSLEETRTDPGSQAPRPRIESVPSPGRDLSSTDDGVDPFGSCTVSSSSSAAQAAPAQAPPAPQPAPTPAPAQPAPQPAQGTGTEVVRICFRPAQAPPAPKAAQAPIAPPAPTTAKPEPITLEFSRIGMTRQIGDEQFILVGPLEDGRIRFRNIRENELESNVDVPKTGTIRASVGYVVVNLSCSYNTQTGCLELTVTPEKHLKTGALVEALAEAYANWRVKPYLPLLGAIGFTGTAMTIGVAAAAGMWVGPWAAAVAAPVIGGVFLAGLGLATSIQSKALDRAGKDDLAYRIGAKELPTVETLLPFQRPGITRRIGGLYITYLGKEDDDNTKGVFLVRDQRIVVPVDGTHVVDGLGKVSIRLSRHGLSLKVITKGTPKTGGLREIWVNANLRPYAFSSVLLTVGVALGVFTGALNKAIIAHLPQANALTEQLFSLGSYSLSLVTASLYITSTLATVVAGWGLFSTYAEQNAKRNSN